MNDLAPYVAILGRGQGRARSLTLEEAEAAMTVILSGNAAPEAVGAMLMLLRMKGETAPEIAGFTAAARAHLPAWSGAKPAIDWPSYAAGRTRGQPWFLLAAKLVARAGYPVLIHGWNSHQSSQASVRAALPLVGIESMQLTEASAQLARDGIAYLQLEDISPALMTLLRLREVLGLRSCINTVLRMLNPGGADVALQGVFHPSYRELQRDAAHLLGQRHLRVLKGGGGEFEHHPTKDITLHGLKDGQPWDGSTGISAPGHQRLSQTESGLLEIWSGNQQDAFATAIITSTAALALDAVGHADPMRTAQDLWNNRHRAQAA